VSVFTWIIPASSTPDTAPAADGVIDHVTTAIGRLRAWARGKTGIENILRSLLEESVTVEEQLTLLRDNRSVDTATGIVLDLLGGLVGELRAGATDDDYRRLVRARIAINRSSGVVENVLRVVRLVLDDDTATVKAVNVGGAEARIEIRGAAVPLALADQIGESAREAAGAGIQLQIISSAAAPAATLRFDTPSTTFDGPAVMVDVH
jgi:hypothetical protein